MHEIEEHILEGALSIVKRLQEAGFAAYFAGGYARDKIMKVPSFDIDIATSASVEQIGGVFDRCYFVGAHFGVVQVIIGDVAYEVATFRKDLPSSDGRHPQAIEMTSPKEDALRRDFTINGMFYDPLEDQVIDYVGGKEDVLKKQIRSIGDPAQRFEEDRLRMIRAVRFAVRFGFKIEKKTEEAIRFWAGTLFPSVSWERILDELKKMSKAPAFEKAIIRLKELELLKQIFPELPLLQENNLEEISRMSVHIPLVLKLHVLLGEMEIEKKEEIFQRLKMSRQEVKIALLFDGLEKAMRSSPKNKQEIAHLLASAHSAICVEAFASVYPGQELELRQLASNLDVFVQKIKNKKPIISSKELQGLGIQPGPLMGSLIKEAERIAIENDLQEPRLILDQLFKSKLWPR